MIQNYAIIETKSNGKWVYLYQSPQQSTFLMCDYDFYDDLMEYGEKKSKDITLMSLKVIEDHDTGRQSDHYCLDLKTAREIVDKYDIETRPQERVFGMPTVDGREYRVIYWFTH